MHLIPTFVFVLAVALLVYLVLAYTLLLAVFPWRRRLPIQKDPAYRRSVSILLPVFNGQAFLRQKLESILALDYPRDQVEILVISDASTDGTDAIAEEFSASGVRLLRVPRGGKAAALNAGIEQAKGEILFFTDVR